MNNPDRTYHDAVELSKAVPVLCSSKDLFIKQYYHEVCSHYMLTTTKEGVVDFFCTLIIIFCNKIISKIFKVYKISFS